MCYNRQSNAFNILEQLDEDTYRVALPNIKYTTSFENAVNWLYPDLIVILLPKQLF